MLMPVDEQEVALWWWRKAVNKIIGVGSWR